MWNFFLHQRWEPVASTTVASSVSLTLPKNESPSFSLAVFLHCFDRREEMLPDLESREPTPQTLPPLVSGAASAVIIP